MALAMAATLAACSSGKSGKGDNGSQPTPTDTNATPQPTSVVETERIDQGDAMVQARNRNAAGFQTDMASRTVTVTQPCFATADPARLDMLARRGLAARHVADTGTQRGDRLHPTPGRQGRGRGNGEDQAARPLPGRPAMGLAVGRGILGTRKQRAIKNHHLRRG